jgi:hypothetical protein
VRQKTEFIDNIPLFPIEKWILDLPHDTLSIYFFSQDTLNKYSWEEIQRDYKILRRYDLSIEDIHKLHNEYDIPVITYPPTGTLEIYSSMGNPAMQPKLLSNVQSIDLSSISPGVYVVRVTSGKHTAVIKIIKL